MNTLTERLALIIDGHTDGAVSAVRRLSVEEKVAADRAELLEVKIAALNTRIAKSATGATGVQRLQLSRMNTEYKGLTSNLANVPRLASKASRALGGIVSPSMLATAAKAGPAAATAALALGEFDFLKSGVDKYVQLAGEIRQVQQAASSTVPDASKLVAITNALGIDANVAALGLFRLGKNIELTPQKLSSYDIAVARTKTGNVDLIGTLENVASRYQATVDPAKRAALVYQAFGRQGATMLPILNASKKTIEGIVSAAAKSGRIFSTSDLERSREFSIATRELKDSFEGLAISAGRSLVPALTKVANVLTTVGDFANKSHLLDFLIPAVGIADLFGGGGDGGGHQRAVDELQAQQDEATQSALSSAARGTLAGGFDTLAAPANIASAKKTLAAANLALDSAKASQRSAANALTTLRSGSPTSAADEIAAAVARIAAAEARLREALYRGGDARIATARAGLLTAQATLNKLRSTGGDSANKLAAAEDRLRRAQERTRAAQSGVRSAQTVANQSSGLPLVDVLKRQRAQVQDQAKLATANLRLAVAGVSADAIAAIDKLNQQAPGTLVKVAAGVGRRGVVHALNAEQGALATVQQQFADAASNPALFAAAGRKAGNAFVDGFGDVLSGAIPKYGPPMPKARAGTRPAGTYAGLLTQGIQLNVGTVKVDSRTGAQLAADLARHTRLGRLGGGLARASAA